MVRDTQTKVTMKYHCTSVHNEISLHICGTSYYQKENIVWRASSAVRLAVLPEDQGSIPTQ